MLRLLPVVYLVLSAGPALAQQFPAAPLRAPGEQMRSFSLKNESKDVVTSAQAHMTDGKDRVLTYAPVQPNETKEIVVPRAECLDSVAVHLNNGHTLRADHMNDCKAAQVVVGDAGIGTQSNAR